MPDASQPITVRIGAKKPVVSIVLPTFNERENLPHAIGRIDASLQPIGLAYEIIIVDDDSPDRTWSLAEQLIKTRDDLHLIRRIGRRGLSSAIVEGLRSARGELLVVMDADLQHDAAILGEMAKRAREGGAELVIATRYAEGGEVGEWSLVRWLMSRLATLMSRLVIRSQVSDPMSGFFMISQPAFARVVNQLDPRGFKILLEIIARSPPLKVGEVGYTFQPRQHGESKLDSGVGIAYLRALYDLSLGRFLPLRFLLYCLVGASGVVVNLGVLWLLKTQARMETNSSLVIAIGMSMLSNFVLNNLLTFSDRRKQGLVALAMAFALFAIVSAAGAVINFSVTFLFTDRLQTNLYVADLVGIALSTVWNYSLNRHITWKKKRDAP
jgi:dolichol-phosphate mannosyltransferase